MRIPDVRGVAFRRVLSHHRLFVVFLFIGVLLRVLTTVAGRPAFLLWGDSYQYLDDASRLTPGRFHPLGYGVFLRGSMFGTGRLILVPIVQHVLVLAAAVLVYVVVLRLTRRPWLAALATVPVLLDVLQLAVEQTVVSDALFQVLLVAAIGCAVLRRRPGFAWVVAAGLLLAVATLTRSLALFLVVPFVGYGLLARWGWRRVGAFAAAMLVPVAAYAAGFHHEYGRYALETSEGAWLYGRVQQTVPCQDVRLPASEQHLCQTVRFDATALPFEQGISFYTWNRNSPLNHWPGVPHERRQVLARDYAKRLVKAHPVTYVVSVAELSGRYFAWTRRTDPTTAPPQAWMLHTTLHPRLWHILRAPTTAAAAVSPTTMNGEPAQPLPAPAAVLTAYQHVGRLPGPLLAAALALALVVGVRRRRHAVDADRRDACLLLATSALLLVLVPAATVAVSYRYLLPVFVTAWPAGALAVATLLDRRANRSGDVGSDDAAATRVAAATEAGDLTSA